ncbi:acetylcholine receptor subunit delta [Caerostris extrusa]|uniref:Acetylcholine receptor subunit delta n=1 Tax=Caerostris extrusa TaxID=172846 RepID=A0AAV4XRZ2_CAEEX|nr:acetylcholine receptor subunit delta [Caerostris extrusa]
MTRVLGLLSGRIRSFIVLKDSLCSDRWKAPHWYGEWEAVSGGRLGGCFEPLAFRTSNISPSTNTRAEVIIVSVSEEGDLLQTNYSTTIQHATYVRTNHLKENNLWSLLSAKSSKTRMEIDDGIMSDVGIFAFEFERTMPMVALAVLTPSLYLLGTFTLGEILPVTGAVTPIIVEYIASVLVLSTFSLLQDVLMSLLASCRKQPPISFTTVLEKFPKWALSNAGISSSN